MTQNLHPLQDQKQSWRALAELGLACAAIMHEVKNSLQGVASALFILEHEPGLGPKARQQVTIAKHELSRVFEASAQTLALVRPEKPVPVRVADILDEVLKVYSAKIAHKQIKIERRYEFAGEIESNPGALRQAFSNLVLNALEAAPRDTGRLTVHTYARCPDHGRKKPGVQIEFADNGPGIPEENKQKIFEPLFSTKTGKGSGLGLWITHRLVEKHHGQLRLLNRKECDDSTCFSVFLPLKAA